MRWRNLSRPGHPTDRACIFVLIGRHDGIFWNFTFKRHPLLGPGEITHAQNGNEAEQADEFHDRYSLFTM